VNKVGDVAHNESFTGFKSKEHCRVTARVDACYQHHLQRRRRFNHINTIFFLLKNGERITVYGRTYNCDHDSSYILVCLFYDFSAYVFSACISQSQFRPTFKLTAGAARLKIENLQNPTFGSCAAASLLNSSG
jgi:hypothetical protein